MWRLTKCRTPGKNRVSSRLFGRASKYCRRHVRESTGSAQKKRGPQQGSKALSRQWPSGHAQYLDRIGHVRDPEFEGHGNDARWMARGKIKKPASVTSASALKRSLVQRGSCVTAPRLRMRVASHRGPLGDGNSLLVSHVPLLLLDGFSKFALPSNRK